ncbi:MAG: hypothetical protein ACREX3_08010 [Gammaproteobacteria bacterium]
MLRPTPLGQPARLQLAGLSAPSFNQIIRLPEVARIPRPIDAYAELVAAVR